MILRKINQGKKPTIRFAFTTLGKTVIQPYSVDCYVKCTAVFVRINLWGKSLELITFQCLNIPGNNDHNAHTRNCKVNVLFRSNSPHFGK